MNQNPQTGFRFTLLMNHRVSNAPRDFEEVLGLDDLFPTPETAVNLDGSRAASEKGSSKNQKAPVEKPKNLALVNYAFNTVKQQSDTWSCQEAPIADHTAKVSIGDQLKKDQALETDISSCEYMVRNNRILSDSIISLAERYFESASEEA
jgi:hypothetical protein